MPYYGFQPQMKQTGTGIALAGREIGGAIQQLPGAIRKKKEYEFDKKQREEAIDALEKDWKKAGLTWKTFKSGYQKRAQKLGLSQGQIDADLKEFPMPKESDRKNRQAIDNYIVRLGQVHQNKNDKLTKLEREKQTGEQVQQAIGGREEGFAQPEVSPEQKQIQPIGAPEGEGYTEQDITAREFQPAQAPAATREEAAGR
jgi:hypothetical protein